MSPSFGPNKLRSLSWMMSLCALVMGSALPSSANESLPATPPASLARGDFLVLCYHDIVATKNSNFYSVTQAALKEQFAYLKKNYHVVGMDDVLAAHQGKKVLPRQAVVLTFDDGLESMYSLAFPLLKEYGFKALFAPVVKWTEDGIVPNYNPAMPDGSSRDVKTASWVQMREMVKSGLVQIAPHTYDLHHGELFNPQGNEAPAAAFFKYNSTTHKYETPAQFRARLRSDLEKAVSLIYKNSGQMPKVMVWPYGAFNGFSLEIARELGMPIQFTLTPGPSNIKDLHNVNRAMITSNVDLPIFIDGMKRKFVTSESMHSMRVDLNMIYDADPAIQDQRLGRLLDHLLDSGVNTVFLKAFVGGNGEPVSEVFFPNTQISMKGDFLSRIAHQIRDRTKVKYVYVWMPLTLSLPRRLRGEEKYLQSLYESLALGTDATGVLFQGEESSTSQFQTHVAMESYRKFKPNAEFIRGLSHLSKDDSKNFKAFGEPEEGRNFVWQSTKPYSTTAFLNLMNVAREFRVRINL